MQNLVKIHPPVHEISCKQSVKPTLTPTPTPTLTLKPTPTGSAPKTICPPPLRWGDIMICSTLHLVNDVLLPLNTRWMFGLNVGNRVQGLIYLLDTKLMFWSTWWTQSIHLDLNAGYSECNLADPLSFLQVRLEIIQAKRHLFLTIASND